MSLPAPAEAAADLRSAQDRGLPALRETDVLASAIFRYSSNLLHRNRWAKSPEDRDDIAQKVTAELTPKICNRQNEPGCENGLVHRTTRNRAIDHTRRRQAIHEVLPTEEPGGPPAIERQPDDAPLPDEVLTRGEDREIAAAMVAEVLAELGPRYRDVLYAVWFEGQTIAGLAEALLPTELDLPENRGLRRHPDGAATLLDRIKERIGRRYRYAMNRFRILVARRQASGEEGAWKP